MMRQGKRAFVTEESAEAADEAREKWRRAFDMVGKPSLYPTIRYLDMHPSELRSHFQKKGRGAVVVTFHFADYPLLLCASPALHEKCLVVAKPSIVRSWHASNGQHASNLKLIAHLGVQHLRECRNGQVALLMLADLTFANAPEMLVPAYGSIIAVSPYWAWIAKRLEVDVIVLIGREEGGELQVHATVLAQQDESAFQLVRRAFQYLEHRMPDQENLWYNRFVLRRGHVAIGNSAEGLHALMIDHARADAAAMRAVKKAIGKQGVAG